ncbi:MAG: DUF3179 domain-containing protein [Acidimicrobiia bacterium]|nr:DUF3179 domain-containing protein [Acidimicrobiia bacterium]
MADAAGILAASACPVPAHGDGRVPAVVEHRRSQRGRMPRRLVGLGVVVAVAAAACLSGTGSAPPGEEGTRSDAPAVKAFAVEQVPPSPREAVVPALEISEIPDIPTTIRFEDPSFGPPAVASGDLRPGGPPPDGIPAIDEPRFHNVDDVDFLSDREPVFVLEIDGDARAYPLQILTWHEIVNDTVAGIPVAVTYCPLCNSAFAYDRRHDGRVLDFGVSGALWNSSLVMYDRQTSSLWGHFTGEGILGVLAGVRLDPFPVALASWAEFAAAHPDGLILSRETGFAKDYGRNPYPGYDDVGSPPFLYDGEVDGRYAAKTRVIGVQLEGAAFAVTADRLAADRVVFVEAAGRSSCGGNRARLPHSTPARWRTVATWAPPRSSTPASTGTCCPSRHWRAAGSGTGRPARVGTCSARPPRGSWPAGAWRPWPTSTPSGSPGPRSSLLPPCSGDGRVPRVAILAGIGNRGARLTSAPVAARFAAVTGDRGARGGGNEADLRWDRYVVSFHRGLAGITERVLARARGGGLDPYAWCAEALPGAAGGAAVGPVLDVACGSGPMASHVSSWIGVDRSGEELAAARAGGRGPLVQALGNWLPVRDGSCAAVVSSMGLQVLQPLEAMVVELARVVRAGGAVVVLLPAGRPLPLRDVVLYVRLQARLRRRVRYPNDRALGRGRLRVLAARHGLHVVEDRRRAFELPLEVGGDAETLIDSLYLPDVSPRERAAALELLRRRTGGVVGIPLRRVVLGRL